jgi:hypothetical protein
VQLNFVTLAGTLRPHAGRAYCQRAVSKGLETMNEARLKVSLRIGVGIGAVLLPLGAMACGGSEKAASIKTPESARAEALQHEDCSTSGRRVDALDTNGDGKPDITRVFDKGSGREVCAISDLSHDGKPDMYEYFDDSGTIRRREFCYDDTGLVNAIEHYEGGKLVSREYDAAGQHHIDTWDFFDPSVAPDPKTGRPAHPVRRERDTTGDGHIDQWWTWNGDKITIAVDNTGDGKPDPEATVVLGADSPASAAPAAAPPAPTDDGGGAAPASAAPDGGKS